MSFTAGNTDYLTRTNLWAAELKDTFEFDLMAQKYVRMIPFPDGDTLNIPSLGQFEVQDYAENMPTRYTAFDTGNFTFTINEYKQLGTYITRKAKQDLFYASQLVSSFVPKMSRALAEQMEADVLAIGPDGQTASDPNEINDAAHRWIGSGTDETIDVKDFALANYALDQAGVPRQARVAIVDPSVEYKLNTLTNITNISNNPTWEGIISTGHRTGMRFMKNIYGFDVYVSSFLKTGVNQTIVGPGGSRTSAAGVANVFFSAAGGDVLPFIGAVRQSPIVDHKFNMDFQRDEWVVTCRYGYKLWRPENLVVVITDTDQVS
jgi:hypothetical protein